MNQNPPRSSTWHFRPWEIWRNPIFLRYCQSRLRLRGLGISLLVVVLLAGFFVTLAMAIGVRVHANPADAARCALLALLGLQALILFILGTAQSAGGMVA